MDPTTTSQPEHHDHDATIQQISAMLAERDLRIEQLQAELNRIQQRVASLEALEPRIAEQEAELLRPQEPPPVSSARVDAHLATKEVEASGALNAAETAA